MRATVDANVFVYMLDARDVGKQSAAGELVRRLRGRDCCVSLQACGELYAALTRRLRRASWEAAQASNNLLTAFPSFGPSRRSVERALAEARAGRFGYWDALLLASAHEAGCTVCFSEDMADGKTLGSVEVVAPFGPDGLSDRARSFLDRSE
jgi:predicted nucleic acid-binding protein